MHKVSRCDDSSNPYYKIFNTNKGWLYSISLQPFIETRILRR